MIDTVRKQECAPPSRASYMAIAIAAPRNVGAPVRCKVETERMPHDPDA